MEDEVAAIPSVHSGTRYAVDVAPERKRVTKISGEPGNYQETVISDYKTLIEVSDEVRQMADKMAGVKQVGRPDELAASNSADQNYLMQAWQALVMYIGLTEEDTNREPAMQALRMVSNLMNHTAEPNQPAPTGAFNATAMASRDSYDCACSRSFSTEVGLVNHLKAIHLQGV